MSAPDVRDLNRALFWPVTTTAWYLLMTRLVSGIRALIIAMTSLASVLGIVYGSRATLLIAAVILTEELYETGVVLLMLRRHRS